MFVHKNIGAMIVASAISLLLSSARADETVAALTPSLASALPQAPVAEVAASPAADPPATLLQQTSRSIETTVQDALDLIGIRYRRGGSTPETGFDCSGFVSHVFREGLGLYLPHSAREMSRTGSPVARADLKPGDLVFFNTVRKTISHVGIYIGDNLFVHAPRRGSKVRIEDLGKPYWLRHFSGARRIAAE